LIERTSRGRRRVVGLALLACGAVLAVAATPASAYSTFGGWDWSYALEYGGSVNIRTPDPASETIASNEISLARLVTQGPGSDPGLVQAGLYRSGTNAQLDTCGSEVNQYEFYYEWRRPSGNYICGLTGSGNAETATPGADNGVSVQGYSDGSWSAYVTSGIDGGGPYLDPVSLGFATGIVSIGDELNNGDPNNPANGSTVSTLYGRGADEIGNGGPGWYVYFHAMDPATFGSPGFISNPLRTSRTSPTSLLWSQQNVPTPLTISHRP